MLEKSADVADRAASAPVLIARHVDEESINDQARNCYYAVERVKRGLYALSKLSRGWTKEADFEQTAKGLSAARTQPAGLISFDFGEEPARKRRCGVSAAHANANADVDDLALDDWWGSARVADPEVAALKCDIDAGRRARFEASVAVVFENLEQPPPTPSPVQQVDAHLPTCVRPAVNSATVETDSPGAATLSIQSLLDGLRDQYLKTLYESKVSDTNRLEGVASFFFG